MASTETHTSESRARVCTKSSQFPCVRSVKRQTVVSQARPSSTVHRSAPPPPLADHLAPRKCTEEVAPSSTCSPEPASCPGCREVGPGSLSHLARPPPPRPPRWTHQDGPVGCPGTLRRREERSSACGGGGGDRGRGGGISFWFQECSKLDCRK